MSKKRVLRTDGFGRGASVGCCMINDIPHDTSKLNRDGRDDRSQCADATIPLRGCDAAEMRGENEGVGKQGQISTRVSSDAK